MRKIFVAVFVLVSFVVGPPGCWAEGWDVKEFKVYVDTPPMTGSALFLKEIDDVAGFENQAEVAEFARKVEEFLGEIARKYEAQGFLPPALEVLDGKYAVYFYNFGDTESIKKPGSLARVTNQSGCEV